MQNIENLLTVPEAAAVLAVSDRTVTRLVAAGQIESIKIGRCRRIRRSALNHYINQLQRSEREQAVGF